MGTYSAKQRKTMSLEDFGDPDRRLYPIKDQDDVDSAAHLIGKAHDPEAVKSRVIEIAKRKGLSIPDAWQEKKKERAMGDEVEVVERSATEAADVDLSPQRQALYMPIVRFDETNWTVTGQATVEDVDAYGTIFDYEASKRAFSAWRGNVREQHDPKRAVGRAIDVQFDDDSKRILVTTKVSRGAKDTWEKIKDGTLSGYSVGAMARPDQWGEVERSGKKYPLLKDYNLVELSLVDNPATPGCNIEIVRADGVASQVVAEETEADQAEISTEMAEPTDARAGARISGATQGTLHQARDAALLSARSLMGACDCAECQAAVAELDPDNDGDVDLPGGAGDTDDDAPAARMLRMIEDEIKHQLGPVVTRLNAIAAQFMTRAAQPTPAPVTVDTSAIDRALATLTEQASTTHTLVERIAAQPMPGGPITNIRAMDKVLATGGPGGGQNQALADAEAIKRAAELGLFKDQTSQVNAAAQLIKLQQGM